MILFGQSRQKGNTLKRGRGNTVFHSKDYLKSFNDFILQAKAQWNQPMIEGDVVMTATIYYQSLRSDLDDSLICDVLEKAGVIKNDRQIKEKHLFHGLDRANPRIEVEVVALAEKTA